MKNQVPAHAGRAVATSDDPVALHPKSSSDFFLNHGSVITNSVLDTPRREKETVTHAYALRPAWTPLTIALMVIGFIVFWPLGLLMLAYIIWGHRVPELRRHFDGMKQDVRSEFHNRGWGCGGSRSSGFTASGNVAFDEYRSRELKRLEEERRRLDEERHEFETFMQNLRRARDQEEFDRFMRDRRAMKPGDEDKTIDL
jgi:hypothetical protein